MAFTTVNCSIFIFLYLLHWSVYITVKQIFAFKGHSLSLPSFGDIFRSLRLHYNSARIYNVLTMRFFIVSDHYKNIKCRIQSIIGNILPLASLFSWYFSLTLSVLLCFSTSTGTHVRLVLREFDINHPTLKLFALSRKHRAQLGTQSFL